MAEPDFEQTQENIYQNPHVVLPYRVSKDVLMGTVKSNHKGFVVGYNLKYLYKILNVLFSCDSVGRTEYLLKF